MRSILCLATQIFIYMIIVRVVLSWFPATSGGVVAQISFFVGRVTEPVFDWVRRFMPRTGALDLTPLVVFLFLQIVVQGMILRC
ncbi:MAG: YggT family protein [Actinomycetota bacterium]